MKKMKRKFKKNQRPRSLVEREDQLKRDAVFTATHESAHAVLAVVGGADEVYCRISYREVDLREELAFTGQCIWHGLDPRWLPFVGVAGALAQGRLRNGSIELQFSRKICDGRFPLSPSDKAHAGLVTLPLLSATGDLVEQFWSEITTLASLVARYPRDGDSWSTSREMILDLCPTLPIGLPAPKLVGEDQAN